MLIVLGDQQTHLIGFKNEAEQTQLKLYQRDGSESLNENQCCNDSTESNYWDIKWIAVNGTKNKE